MIYKQCTIGLHSEPIVCNYFLNNPSVLPLKAFAVKVLSDLQQDYRVCAPRLHLCLSVFAE